MPEGVLQPPPMPGGSVLWDNGRSRRDLGCLRDFARLLASVGINGCAVGIVNADPRLLDPGFVTELQRIADVLRPWGIRIVLPVDFGSPQSIGKLDTFDPLDARVAEWWRDTVNALYEAIPDLAGFVMKADSEGPLGPSVFKRTHAEGTRPIADALRPHGGVLFFRAFVYNHHLDWTNPGNNRARAA